MSSLQLFLITKLKTRGRLFAVRMLGMILSQKNRLVAGSFNKYLHSLPVPGIQIYFIHRAI